MRDRVLVTLCSGEVFAGVLYEADDRSLVLRNSAAVGVAADRADVPVDGELLVLLTNVAFIQRP